MDTRATVRSWWPVAALALGAIAIALLSQHFVSPAQSWNRDESVYLWQVGGLRAGQFTAPTGGHPSAFQPWLAGIRNNSFFSQYTLGWPLLLLGAELAFGSPTAALAVGAALTVVGTYLLARELTKDSRVALIAGALMLASPILVIQSGIYLGYLFTLGLGLLFATATLSGFRRARRGRLVLGGVLVGWIFMTRPFDAVLWSAAVVGCLAWKHRREPRLVLRSLVALAVGFIPLLVATLLYNQHVTGAFGQFPITAADPLDTFGFGHRRIMPKFIPANFTPWQGLRSSMKQAVYLPIFMTGSYLLAAIAGWGLWRGRRELPSRVLLAIAVAFPLGYYFFWGIYVSSVTMPLSGPIYYIPIYAVLAVAAARELVRLWGSRRRIAVWLTVGIVVVTIPVGFDRVDVNRRISEAQLPWKKSSAAVPAHSLVFEWRSGRYLMFINPFAMNRPNLDGPVLYSTDRGARNLDLIAAYPDRTPYLQQTSLPPHGEVPNDHPETPEITLVPLRVVRGRAVELRSRTGDRRADGLTFSTSISGPIDSVAAQGTRTQMTFVLDPTGVEDGTGTLRIELGRGRTTESAGRHAVIRQDVHYRVADGVVEVATPISTFKRRKTGHTRRWEVMAPGVESSVSLLTVAVPRRNQ